MENVIVSTFDSTIYTSRPLSDLTSFAPLKAGSIYNFFPKLERAAQAISADVILCTRANILKYKKANAYPKYGSVYFDCFTSTADSDSPTLLTKFQQSFDQPISSADIRNFFEHCARNSRLSPSGSSYCNIITPQELAAAPSDIRPEEQPAFMDDLLFKFIPKRNIPRQSSPSTSVQPQLPTDGLEGLQRIADNLSSLLL